VEGKRVTERVREKMFRLEGKRISRKNKKLEK